MFYISCIRQNIYNTSRYFRKFNYKLNAYKRQSSTIVKINTLALSGKNHESATRSETGLLILPIARICLATKFSSMVSQVRISGDQS
jgi:hypothetical protein